MKPSELLRRLLRQVPGGGQIAFSLACALFSLFFLAKDGTLTGYDTIGYLCHWSARPPLYPLILDLFQLVFGPRYQICLIIFQISFVLGAALYLTSVLNTRYRLGGWLVAVCFIILIAPLYGLSSGMRIGNSVLTEALAYGLVLVSAALAAEVAHSSETRHLIALAAVITLNSLLRLQMVFMVPAFGFLLLWKWVRTGSFQRVLRPAAFMMLAGSAAFLGECGYNLYFNGSFMKSRILPPCLARDVLYLSDSQDLTLFKDAGYYPAMRRVYAEMDGSRLFSKYRHEHDANLARYLASAADPRFPFNWRSEVIFWHLLARHLYRYLAEGKVDGEDWSTAYKVWGHGPSYYTNAGAWLKVNAAGRDIFLRLLRRHRVDYIKLQLSRLSNEVGALEAMLLLFLLVLPFARGTELNIFVAFVTLAAACNLLAIIMTNAVIPRYTFYTDELEAAALLIWFIVHCRSGPRC